ncbi:Na+/H+ antiporter NhaC family protein [Mesobacillus harenae]|uniref:Na+/H+ antiporter NhaC family protein n=1 Tax=Mesobacillus harenae TaxID=2213203 RepID=UPI00157FDF51|nr:Na+/H+ antiporter NhaC family protein [Mesobacillus harenae]
MEGTIYSLIPPILAIGMALLTRRVLLSLGVGIVSAAFLLSNMLVGETLSLTWTTFSQIFYIEGGINTWNVYMLVFVLQLGIFTGLVTILGGTKAFGAWLLKRVKTRKGASLFTTTAGVLIFIDDYFNCMAVGQISRPLTDQHRISRAKLAYFIDSTAAPVVVISPFSSWGAYVIGIIGSILATHGITEYSPLSAYLQIIPMNLYAISAIVMTFLVAFYNFNIGPMKLAEKKAQETGELFDRTKPIPGELKTSFPISDAGGTGDLIWPIFALISGTIASIVWLGYKGTKGKATMFSIFENTDIATALVYGGFIGIAVASAFVLKQILVSKSIQPAFLPKVIYTGMASMLSACFILIFAWMIGTLIAQIETGSFLAHVVENSNISTAVLPAVIFLVAIIMSFSTGTSWGTFGIMLPIAGSIAAGIDATIILPALAAVLAGSVVGDHCSPISDTTILSSTGAGCNHMDHVLTQLPYAIISAIISSAGFLVLGITGSTLLGLATLIVLFLMLQSFIKRRGQTAKI